MSAPRTPAEIAGSAPLPRQDVAKLLAALLRGGRR